MLSDFQQNFTTDVDVCTRCTRANKQVQEPWAKLWGGETKGGHNNNNNHTTNHIANCLVVLAIWEDALVIVVCYTWVLAAFSFLLSAALIEYYFWHVLRLAAFCVVPWPKIKADIIQKQTKHQMSTMNLESSLEFCTRGRRRRGSKRGWKGAPSTSPARKRNKHFVCEIKVPLLLNPSPLSPTCYSFASPFLAINSLHKFLLCCIIKKLNSFFFCISLSLSFLNAIWVFLTLNLSGNFLRAWCAAGLQPYRLSWARQGEVEEERAERT